MTIDPPQMHSSRFFTYRCMASIEVECDTFIPCCLKLGHKGPHEPIRIEKQTVKP